MLFAIAVMGTLFGIAGVILAVPAATVLRVLAGRAVGGTDGRDGGTPHGLRGQDEGGPMASIRQALGALHFWLQSSGASRSLPGYVERGARRAPRKRRIGVVLRSVWWGRSLLAGREESPRASGRSGPGNIVVERMRGEAPRKRRTYTVRAYG